MASVEARLALEQNLSRKRKRPSPTRNTTRSPSRLAWKECGTAIDIEDVHEKSCQLVCAPVVPSQSAAEYPLSRTIDWEGYARATAATAGTRARNPAFGKGRSTCRLSRNAESRGRSRDSEFHFSGKFNPEIPDVPPRAAAAAAVTAADSPSQQLFSTIQPSLVSTALHSTTAPSTLSSLNGRPQCLLERVNPEYFAQDKYKWHSSTAQEQDTLEMTSIDPESAQDFTAIYTSDNNLSHQDMSQYSMPSTSIGSPATGNVVLDGHVPELDGASSPSKSAYSSPDSMLQPLPSFDRQASDATSNGDVDAFDDVNQMFDWDGACASLVDDYVPDYKYGGPIMPRATHYNTSIFSRIPTISARAPYAMGEQSGQTIYHASHRMIESSRVNRPYMPQTMASQHADEDDGSGTVCHNCGVTKTPLWRRTPDKRHSLCNACGLYLKQYKTMRPLVPRNRSHVSKKDEENIVCTNCEATKTSLWRKDEEGQVICNACGLYFKLHNKARPVTMRKEKISRRKRYRNLTSETIDIHDPIHSMPHPHQQQQQSQLPSMQVQQPVTQEEVILAPLQA